MNYKVHELNENPIGYITLMHGRLFGILRLTNSAYIKSHNNMGRPCARAWNKVFIWTTFWFHEHLQVASLGLELT